MPRWLLTGLFILSFTASASAMETSAKQALLVDATTKTPLLSINADERMYPSSMTKLMTIYLLFEQLKAGSVALEDTMHVSEEAWSKQGSKMFVELDSDIPVIDLLRGIVVQSGNDACIVVAEGLAGSEEAFAERMNAKAKELGMNGTNFTNATGWPDEDHYTTARDLYLLTDALIRDFPDYYHYFAEEEFTYHDIRQYNRNLLLGRLGVDGLKTGHTEAAGYGIVLSAQKGEPPRRLILVINGLESEKARKEEGAALLRYGFSAFKTVTIAQPEQVLEQAPVWMGKQESVALGVAEPIILTLPKDSSSEVAMALRYDSPIRAPLEQGAKVGELVISLPGGEQQTHPLVAQAPVARAGFFKRIGQNARHYLGKLLP